MTFLLGLTEDQRMLAESVGHLLKTENDFEKRRRRLAEVNADRLALWKSLAEIGVLGLAFPQERGGLGGKPTDIAALQDAVAPSLPVEPIIACIVTAGRLLLSTSTESATALIAKVISGERIPILAHMEKFEPFSLPRMSATRTGSGYVLKGMKPAVRHADVATDLLVTARLGDGLAGMFLVDAEHEGVCRINTRLIDAAGAADVHFDDVELPASALMEFDADLTAMMADALEWTLAMLCVETASLIDASNHATFEYLGIRKQFGQKLASFQALQHRAADMAIAAVESAAAASDAVAALELPPSAERSRRVLLASLACDSMGRQVGHEAIQMHGGMGVSDELVISHYGRRFAAIRNQIGTIDARLARLAQLEGVVQ